MSWFAKSVDLYSIVKQKGFIEEGESILSRLMCPLTFLFPLLRLR